MTQAEIEKTLDQLVRRAKAYDEFMAYLDSKQIESSVRDKRQAINTAHGVVPFEEPKEEAIKYGAEIVRKYNDSTECWAVETPTHYLNRSKWAERTRSTDRYAEFATRDAALAALHASPPPPGWVAPVVKESLTTRPSPQPASEGVRWFRWDSGDTNGVLVSEFPSMKLYKDSGELLGYTHMWSLDLCVSDKKNHTELDGPPPHGKPLAKPATEGDGKPEDTPADRTRLTLYPSRMCEATRTAFDWIKSHDGGAHGALFTRALSDACAEYAAHMTAALTKERDSLRAEVEAQKQRSDANAEKCLAAINAGLAEEKRVVELRAEVERLMATRVPKTSRRPAKKGKGKGVKR